MASDDPFVAHFADPNSNELARRLAAVQTKQWRLQQDLNQTSMKILQYAPSENNDGKGLKRRRETTSLDDLGLKKRLLKPARQSMAHLDETQSSMSTHVFNYLDILLPSRTPRNSASLRNLICLHALNHVFKTRDRVIKNTARLSSEQENGDLDVRDQGFTRPKALILIPTRNSCARYMEAITVLSATEQQENRKRFEDAYIDSEEKHSDAKPLDHRELFEGNVDDNFRLGIKFTRKTTKYYSQFYNSDIILASPLGLRQAIEANE